MAYEFVNLLHTTDGTRKRAHNNECLMLDKMHMNCVQIKIYFIFNHKNKK